MSVCEYYDVDTDQHPFMECVMPTICARHECGDSKRGACETKMQKQDRLLSRAELKQLPCLYTDEDAPESCETCFFWIMESDSFGACHCRGGEFEREETLRGHCCSEWESH